MDDSEQPSLDTERLELHLANVAVQAVPEDGVREPVEARLVRLAGDHFILFEPSAVIRVFSFDGIGPAGDEGATHRGVTTDWVDLEDLTPGMFVLERIRGDSMALQDLSRQLLGQKYAVLTRAQEVWKKELRRLVDARGIDRVARELENLGCSTKDLRGSIRYWMGEENILPGEQAWLFAIMRLAGRNERDAAAAWKAGRALQVVRQQAGTQISKILVRKIGTQVDRHAIEKTGTDEVHLDDAPGSASMKLLRIEGHGPILKVPPRQVRVVLDNLTQFGEA